MCSKPSSMGHLRVTIKTNVEHTCNFIANLMSWYEMKSIITDRDSKIDNANDECFQYLRYGLLGCDTVLFYGRMSTFRTNMLPPSSKLKCVGSVIGVVTRQWLYLHYGRNPEPSWRRALCLSSRPDGDVQRNISVLPP